VIALLVDFAVAGLLLATLSYCILLNRRLAALRDDKGELRELIIGLSAASQRAEAGVASLRVAAEQIGVGLQDEIDRARELRDDLAYMLERGGALADRLEGAIRAHRDETRPAAARPAPRPEIKPEHATEHRNGRRRVEPTAPAMTPDAAERVASFPSRVERDLRRVLEGRR
jgi:hypothetical protein